MDIDTTPGSLVAYLDRLDIRLWVDGDRLRYSAPPGALTPGIRAMLQTQKDDLLVFLRRRGAVDQRRTGDYTAPPSFGQRHFWALQQLHPTACFFNVPYAFLLEGKVDPARLRRSLDEIVRRHELLRTTLRTVDGTLMQVIAPAGQVDMAVADLRDRPPETQRDEVDRFIQSELARPFDLANESCVRVRLLRLREDEQILFLCLHSVMTEDGSLGALLGELGEHYQAFEAAPAGTDPVALPALPMQYADYAYWQQSLLTTGQEARRTYWEQWLAKGDPPLLTRVLANPAPAEETFSAGTIWHPFPLELTEQLKHLSRSAGVTLFVSAIAGYAAPLYRYTGCTDVVVGGPAANRSHWKVKPLIGSTLTILAYRFDLSGDPDVLTLLARVRATVLAAFAHQDVPFSCVAPLLEASNRSANPLFRTVLTFSEDTPHDQLHLPGVTVTFLEKMTNQEIRPELFPVMWEDKQAGGALTSYWLFREDLFSAGAIAQMAVDYQAILTAMTKDPTQTISALPSSRPRGS